MATRPRLTYDELAALPDDGMRYELLEGVVHPMTPPSLKHQRIAIALLSWLYRAQRAGYGYAFGAPIHVVLASDVKFEPDALFIRRGREAILTENTIQGPPDLVIEILSPSNRLHDTVVKFQAYARYGVPHYWIVDPVAELVTRYRLAGSGEYEREAELTAQDQLASPLFPDITMPVAELFQQ
ncbi:MAG TPA: Uma2 family endonuclease [Thermomicrobiales bacterium]|nr:Uma2 family endonuclease [Thermomicrobiales bacterium]